VKTNKDLSRRQFHRKVGEGMLWAGLGTSLAAELGLRKVKKVSRAKKHRALSPGTSLRATISADAIADQSEPLVVRDLNSN